MHSIPYSAMPFDRGVSVHIPQWHEVCDNADCSDAPVFERAGRGGGHPLIRDLLYRYPPGSDTVLIRESKKKPATVSAHMPALVHFQKIHMPPSVTAPPSSSFARWVWVDWPNLALNEQAVLLKALDPGEVYSEERLRGLYLARVEAKLAELASRSDLPLLAFYDDDKTNRQADGSAPPVDSEPRGKHPREP